MKYGFYLWAFRRDCFMESTAKNRTNALATEFGQKLKKRMGLDDCSVSPAEVEYIKSAMHPACMEVKTIESGAFAGNKYITISGDGFSLGTDACPDPFAVCAIV